MNGLQASAPADLGALRAALANAAGPLCIIAGGTDLLVAPREAPRQGWIIDISKISELSAIATGHGELRIGATATFAELARDPLVRRLVPAVARAADLCGSAQIRNRATIGGNVANASPAGDLLPVLKCFDARFHVLDCSGEERILAFGELVTGAGKTSLAACQVITAIGIPLAARLPRSGFVKLGPRDDLTISRINLAMEAEFDPGARTFGKVRMVAGAIAPVPRMLEKAAQELAGQKLSPARMDACLQALASEVEASIPGRASLPYKRRAVMGVGADLLEQVTGIAGLLE